MMMMMRNERMGSTMEKQNVQLQLIREADNLAKCTGMDFRLCLEILYNAGGRELKTESEQINKKKGGT